MNDDEYIIQIAITMDNHVTALTSYGRIFMKGPDGWIELKLPELIQAEEVEG